MYQRMPGNTAGQVVSPGHGRIIGVDVARALAVFGMFTVHLGVGSIGLLGGDPAEALHALVRGNSSALFAFLAGVSLALMTGRGVPLSGTPLHRAIGRVLTRAVVLALLGGALDLLDAPVAVILTYYGGYFILAVPLLRLRARALMVTAAVIGLLGPQVSFVARSAFVDPATARDGSIGGITDFLLTGYYPACTFMAFVVAGMAVGRLDLRSPRVRGWLAGVGAVLAALGYAGSWVLLYPLGGLDRLMRARLQDVEGGNPDAMDPALLEPMRGWMVQKLHDLHGEVPTDSAWWLLVATPHSGTSFEIAGAVGASLLVLTGCVALADVAGAVLRPLAAAGAMALTVYAGHIVVIAWLGASAQDLAPFRLEAFVAGSLVFVVAWQALFGRGPLERVLGRLADGAADLAGPPDEARRPPAGPDRPPG